MYNNRLLQVVSVVVVLMAVAASGVAAASAPTGSMRDVATSRCQAILRQDLGAVMPSGWSAYQASDFRQELGAVMPSGWSAYQESDCSLTGAGSAGLATLDNPNNQWLGPETVAAAEMALKAVAYGPPGR